MTATSDLMTKKIITVRVTTPLQAAYEEMREHGIRHLPVIDLTGKLVGILSDRDLLRASNIRMVSEIEQEMTFNPHHTVEDFMSWPVQTVSEHTPVNEIANMMIKDKVSALVVNGPNHYIKGIVTTEDLLHYLIEIMRSGDNKYKIPVEKLLSRHL